MAENGELSILYIPITRNRDFWQEKIELPSHFINGFDINGYITDQTFDYNNTERPKYHIKGYPIIYLIDTESQTVLAKEISVTDLNRFLNNK